MEYHIILYYIMHLNSDLKMNHAEVESYWIHLQQNLAHAPLISPQNERS